MSESKQSFVMRYIPDSEADLDAEDLLGTRAYVDVLEQTVRQCSTPFTVGLYGSWGSGKSSIVTTLCRRLNSPSDHEPTVLTFIYDAWKYSNDSFYRAFLLQLRETFGLPSTEQMEEFYKDKTADVGHEVVPSKSFWYSLASWSPLILLLFLLLHAQTETKVAVGLLTVIVTVLAQVVHNAFVTYTVTVNRPRTFAPEQFAAAFNEAIDEVAGRDRKAVWFKRSAPRSRKKILIVVDNIDRCDGETARDLLLNIKNFLERPDVVYLLPLDPTAVKRYLKLPEDEASEYLRKIFNASVTLKAFTPNELFDFSQSLNLEHELDLPKTAVSLVCQEFATNPRRIIQFLNTLQNELALARAQENAKLLAAGAVTGNVPFLAKILIIRQEWPRFYDHLSADSGFLGRVEAAIAAGAYQTDPEGNVRKAQGLPDLEPALYRLLLRSGTITSASLDPFFVNKDVFKDVPDVLYELVISQSWDEVALGLREDSWSLEQVVSLAMHVGDVEVVKRGLIATSGNNVIGLLGSMISDPQFGPDARQVLDDYRIRQIANICAVSDVEAVFASLSPDRLVAVARLLLDRGHPDFSQRLSAHLNSEFNQASGGATPRRPEELLIQFALALADTPEQLRGLAPSIGVMATESPIRTASLVERLPATSQSMALAAANSSALVPLLRAENDPDDKDARSTNDAVTMMLRIMRDWGQLSDERTTEYVAACARAMDESEQIDARASWLHRLESWPSRVSDIDVLGQLTTGLAPLAQLSALTSADQGAAAGVATAVLLSEIVVASKAQVPNAQAWLVGVVVSEDISSAVGDAFRDGLSRAVKAFMPWAWPFADDLLACAESSNARGAAFRRTCQLLDLMVRKSTDERGFTKEQLDRVAGALLRDAPASAFGPLLAGTLGNPSAKECVLRRISVPGSVPRSLVPALWEQCSEARVPILNQHVFAGSERSVASGIRKLQSLVGQTALQDSMADYFDSLTGEDAATALRVVRGLSRSSVAAPVGSASKLLLRAVGASDRATNIELLGEAVKLGVPLSMKKQWQEAAKGIDDGGIGHNQKQVLTRARKALGIRRRR